MEKSNMSLAVKGASSLEILEQIRSKKITCVQAVKASLERIEATNSHINACVEVLQESALASAAESDKRIADGETRPLEGLPIVVKVNIEQEGILTTAATPALKDWRPKQDAPVVEILKKAGAIVVARTNMPEMANNISGQSSMYGNCLNPHNLKKSPGGSSSGTAASIAAGIVTCGLGSDTGGSCRIPAENCGIAGFRPSRLRWNSEGCVPLFDHRDTIGCLGATVQDIALIDSVIMGYDFTNEYKSEGDLSTTKVGVPTEWVKDCSQANDAALQLAIDRLQELKVTVKREDFINVPALNEECDKDRLFRGDHFALRNYLLTRAPELGINEQDLLKSMEAQNFFQWWDWQGENQESNYKENLKEMTEFIAEKNLKYEQILEDNGFDFMLVPCTACETVDQDDVFDPDWGALSKTVHKFGKQLNPLSIPSVAVPTSVRNSEGMPTGVLIFGKPGQDKKLLKFAQEVEQAFLQK